MNWSQTFHDVQPFLVPIVSVLGPLATILSILYAVHRYVVKRHLSRIRSLKKQLEAETERIADADREVARLTNSTNATRAELESTARDLVETKHTHSQLTKQVAELVPIVAHLKSENAQMKPAGQQLRIERDQLRLQLAEAKARSQQLEQQSSEWIETRDRLLVEKEFASDENAKRLERIDTLTKQLKEMRRDIREVVKQDGKVWFAPVADDAPAFAPADDRKARVISIVNLKGGVGKTTISANLAGQLGMQGKRVLLLDLDHQRTLTQMLLRSVDRKSLLLAEKCLQKYLLGGAHTSTDLLHHAFHVPGMSGCDLIPNFDPRGAVDFIGLEDLEMQLLVEWLLPNRSGADVRFLLRSGLHDAGVTEIYDYVLLDCPPRMSTACINALAASDFVLIPVPMETSAAESVPHFVSRLVELKNAGICPDVEILGVLGTMATSNPDAVFEAGALGDAIAKASGFWPTPVPLLPIALPKMAQYAAATREIETDQILRLAIDFPSVRKQFETLTRELESRIHENAFAR